MRRNTVDRENAEDATEDSFRTKLCTEKTKRLTGRVPTGTPAGYSFAPTAGIPPELLCIIGAETEETALGMDIEPIMIGMLTEPPYGCEATCQYCTARFHRKKG